MAERERRLDDAAESHAVAAANSADAAAWGHTLDPAGDDTWDVHEGAQGRGYGLSTPDELRTQVAFSRETGLFLDPVYTGKTWGALERAVQSQPDRVGRRALFWHTGGAFGLFGRGGELAAALGAEAQALGLVSGGD